jgi:hypothetical protein
LGPTELKNQPIILDNTTDSIFDEADPSKPVVLNQGSNIAGFEKNSFVRDLEWTTKNPFGELPNDFWDLTALEQWESVVETGIANGYMREWLHLCSMDGRHTMAFHIGSANVENGRTNGWRKGGSGYDIAIPGCFKFNSKKDLSYGFRCWVGAMELITNHLMILSQFKCFGTRESTWFRFEIGNAVWLAL